MKRWLRRTLIGVVAALATGAGAVAWGLHQADLRMTRVINQPPYPLVLPDGEAALARGKYLFASRGCAECHGASGAGKDFVGDSKSALYVRTPNITPGSGSVVSSYTPVDWERVIRHGIKPDGRPLFFMPSEDYNRLTDTDLGALVAYVQKLEPVAGQPAEFRLPLPVRVLYGYGLLTDAAQKIDHSLPPSQPVPEGVTPEHGRYVVQTCVGCHGAGLSGGKIPGAPPDWPAAANLTPGKGSVMPRYTDAESFRIAMRSGKRPDGSAISTVMPFESLRELSDTDIDAMRLYLQTLPPRPEGQR